MCLKNYFILFLSFFPLKNIYYTLKKYLLVSPHLNTQFLFSGGLKMIKLTHVPATIHKALKPIHKLYTHKKTSFCLEKDNHISFPLHIFNKKKGMVREAPKMPHTTFNLRRIQRREKCCLHNSHYWNSKHIDSYTQNVTNDFQLFLKITQFPIHQVFY